MKTAGPLDYMLSNPSVIEYEPVPTEALTPPTPPGGGVSIHARVIEIEREYGDHDEDEDEDEEDENRVTRRLKGLDDLLAEGGDMGSRGTKVWIRMSRYMTFVVCLLLAQGLAGLNPVFNRLLQRGPAIVPPFTYGFIVHGLALILYTPRMMWRAYSKLLQLRGSRRSVMTTGERISQISRTARDLLPAVVGTWAIYAFALTVIMRGYLSYLAAGYTEAAFVSLIDMMAPLVISFLGYLFFRDDAMMSWRVTVVILCSVLGSSMVVVGGKTTGWNIGDTLTLKDVLGVMLAIGSMLSLALRSLFTFYITRHSGGSRNDLIKNITGDTEMAFVITKMIQTAVFLPLMLMFEDTNMIWSLPGNKWVLLALSSVLVHMLAAVLRITGTKHLSMTAEAALQPVMLFSSVVFGMMLLQEYISSLLEVAGIVVICACAVAFVLLRRNAQMRMERKKRSGRQLLPIDDDIELGLAFEDEDHGLGLAFEVEDVRRPALKIPVREQLVVVKEREEEFPAGETDSKEKFERWMSSLA